MIPHLHGGTGEHGSASSGSATRSAGPEEEDADQSGTRLRSKKAPNAFRTISEVADDLHIPQHVLRFWETKFPQLKPLKRGGGRRYYRPNDIALLRRISDLLYIQRYTIKGVQQLLRDGGGKLAEDIPPAPPEERALAVREEGRTGAPELPGLLPRSPPPLRRPGPAERIARAPAANESKQQVESLRALLTETLAELEALRALLP